ncbi:YbgA family protein [Pseudoalteromonas fenneropenaei]|uniref:YbgA family protein n=1 Tax=Pseudoalteromonas fenneropenaei TaxID=1737459 RepID=A0ABV7CMB5_9GAMM
MSIKIGISACLAGQKVRFDSGHKRNQFCMDELAAHVEYVPYCPEVAVGLSIPRPTIRQIRVGDIIKVARPDGSGDVGPALAAYGEKVATEQAHQLSGFVVCAKSPSCGMERVKVYNEAGTGNSSEGVGVFTAQLMKHNPLLPIEENGRLNDPYLRENFILRVYVYHAWQTLRQQPLSLHALTQFHSKYKYLLMSHRYQAYRELGKLLGEAKGDDLEQVASDYIHGLMQALSKPASRKGQANTLMHLQGYFKKLLSREEKQEMSEAIEQYRKGLVPLYVPLTLVQHHVRKFSVAYLQQQAYFAPYPAELRLRFGI